MSTENLRCYCCGNRARDPRRAPGPFRFYGNVVMHGVNGWVTGPTGAVMCKRHRALAGIDREAPPSDWPRACSNCGEWISRIESWLWSDEAAGKVMHDDCAKAASRRSPPASQAANEGKGP